MTDQEQWRFDTRVIHAAQSTDEWGGASHALCDLGGLVAQCDRLVGMLKIRVAINVILEDPPLADDFGCDGTEPVAADTKERFSMSESSVGSFLAHGGAPIDTGEVPQNADAQTAKGQTRVHARHSMHFASS